MKKKQYFLAGIVILVILGIAIAVIFNGRNKNMNHLRQMHYLEQEMDRESKLMR